MGPPEHSVQGNVQADMISYKDKVILPLQRFPDSYIPGGHSSIQLLSCKIG